MAPGNRGKSAESETSEAERLLNIAVANYEDIIVDLHEMKATVRASETYSEAEAKRIVTMVGKTIQTIYDERKRLDDLRKREAGSDDDGAFDLDAARSEVRRRLDRIRAAKDAGDVPG